MVHHRIIVLSFLLLNLDLTTARSHIVTAPLNGQLDAQSNTGGTIQLDNTVKKTWSTPTVGNVLNTLVPKADSKSGNTLDSAQPPISILDSPNAVDPLPETKASNGYIVNGPPNANFKTWSPPGSNFIIAVPLDHQVKPIGSGPQAGSPDLTNPTILDNTPIVFGPEEGSPGLPAPTVPGNPIVSGSQDVSPGLPAPTVPVGTIVSVSQDVSPGLPAATIPDNPIVSGPQDGTPLEPLVLVQPAAATQSVIPETKSSLIQTETPSLQVKSEPTGSIGPEVFTAKGSPYEQVPGSQLIVIKTPVTLPTIVVDTAPGQDPGVVVPGSSIIVAKLPEPPTTKPPTTTTTQPPTTQPPTTQPPTTQPPTTTTTQPPTTQPPTTQTPTTQPPTTQPPTTQPPTTQPPTTQPPTTTTTTTKPPTTKSPTTKPPTTTTTTTTTTKPPTKTTTATTTTTTTTTTTKPSTIKEPIVPQAPTIPGVCVNGLGYVSHPSKCTKFYQCVKTASGSVKATKYRCPYGLFWNSRALSCDYPRNVQCDNHPCRKTKSRYAPMTNKCNGFWLCETKRGYRAYCCPRGTSFSNKRQRCVRDKNCRAKCRRVNRGRDGDDSDDDSSESNESNSSESNEIAACDKRAASDDDKFYEHKVPGNRWIRMPCPLTTAFDNSTCACTKIITTRPSEKRPTLPPPAKRCEPELHLSFTRGIEDNSNNRQYIENKGVVVKNGLAVFNGRSVLQVNRFANSPLGRNLEIELMYTPFNRNRKQVLISNGDRGVTPSVYISMGSSAKTPYITFKLRTTRPRRIKTINLPIVSKSGPIHVKFTLKNGVFTGTVDGQNKSKDGFGEIAVAKSGLVIGSSTHKNKFKGYLDYVKMYFCDSQQK